MTDQDHIVRLVIEKWGVIYMNEKLKPCPFCGKLPIIKNNGPDFPGFVRVICQNVGNCYCANMDHVQWWYSVEEAIFAWNTRAVPDELPEWAKAKIADEIKSVKYCIELNNEEPCTVLEALDWVLSLKRGEE
jgi:hypothetical protein